MAMITLAEWNAQGAQGIFTVRRNKGRGRVTLIFIERMGNGFEERRFNYGWPQIPIWRQWHSSLETVGVSLMRMGTVTYFTNERTL